MFQGVERFRGEVWRVEGVYGKNGLKKVNEARELSEECLEKVENVHGRLEKFSEVFEKWLKG